MAGRLGDILVARGWLSDEQLQSCLQGQGAQRGMLGAVLLSRGLITVEQLGEALAEQFEVPFVRVHPDTVHPQVARLLPESLARERQMVPVQVHDGTMRLAMVAPDDIEAISEAELITGYQVDPVVALHSDVLETLDASFDERVAARQTIVDMKFADLKASAASKRDEETQAEPTPQDTEAPVVRLVRSILMGAVNAGASDIHLEPHVPEMRVRYRIDGNLQQVMTIPNHTEEAVVGRIKVMADMDTTEKRKPQDGNLTIEENGVRASFRVSTIPTVSGEKVCMRVLNENNRVFTFEALGMTPKEIEITKMLIDKPHGMIVVTGPTGSGKTTTMYTMLTNIDSTLYNISTVEDPVEFRLPGINQVQANNEHGMGFANALKYLMRQDPDVILVGEIRDHETATTAVQAALTGHLLISTLHTNDAVGAIPRLNDLGVDRFKIAAALLAAYAQRLLRGLCPACKEPTQPNARLLEALFQGQTIPDGLTFFTGRGCKKCGGTGYVGRIPIYEIMVMTPELVKAVEAGLPTSKLREIARSQGMRELTTNGIEQALAGRTTVEEVYFKLSS
jgi:type IV pilus assembly protein PilB